MSETTARLKPMGWLASILYFGIPSLLFSASQDGTFGGMDMEGRWDILALMTVTIVVLNIGGEELWWRGIILPRQELAFGQWAWLVNGLLWDLFHFFYHSNAGSIVAYLPSTLPLAWVAQRTRSTWPGIIAHLIANRGALIVLYQAITR